MPDNQLSPIFHIEADKIKPNPYQPRRNFDEDGLKELAGSIQEFGILHPLVVSKVETQTEFGTNVEYILISGERRLMAAKIAGLERVPAIIRKTPTEQERLELAIIENIQREDLNPIETARAYAKLQDQFGLTQREVAVRVGKSREVVANSVRLLNLPTQIQDAVSSSQINESQARLLLSVPELKEQQEIFETLIRDNLSVRELRNRIHAKKNQGAPQQEALKTDPETEQLEEQLRELLGTKVKLQKDKDGGKLTISFYSNEELLAIIQKLIAQKQQSQEKDPTQYARPIAYTDELQPETAAEGEFGQEQAASQSEASLAPEEREPQSQEQELAAPQDEMNQLPEEQKLNKDEILEMPEQDKEFTL